MASGDTAIFQGDDTLNFGDVGEGKESFFIFVRICFLFIVQS